MAADRCPVCYQRGNAHKMDCPRARHGRLTFPTVGPAPEPPSPEAEREARIRADERAAIVARIRRGAANPWTPEPERRAWERLADLIETEGPDVG